MLHSFEQMTSLIQEEYLFDKFNNRLMIGDSVVTSDGCGYMSIGVIYKINTTTKKLGLQIDSENYKDGYYKTKCNILGSSCISIRDIPKKHFTNMYNNIQTYIENEKKQIVKKYFVNFLYVTNNGERGVGYVRLFTNKGETQISKTQYKNLEKELKTKYPNTNFYYFTHISNNYLNYVYMNNKDDMKKMFEEMFEYTKTLSLKNIKSNINNYFPFMDTFNNLRYYSNYNGDDIVFYSLDKIIENAKKYNETVYYTKLDIENNYLINLMKGL